MFAKAPPEGKAGNVESIESLQMFEWKVRKGDTATYLVQIFSKSLPSVEDPTHIAESVMGSGQ